MSQQGSLVAELVNEMGMQGGIPPQMQMQPPQMQYPPGPQGPGVPPQMDQYHQQMMMQQQMMPQQMPQQYPQMGGLPPQMGGLPPGQMHGRLPDLQQQQLQYGDMEVESGEEYVEDDDVPQPPTGETRDYQTGPMDTSNFGMDTSKSWMDRFIDALKEPLIIGVLFALLSLPQVSRLLIQFLPVVGNNLYYSIGFKALLAALLYFAIRYFL